MVLKKKKEIQVDSFVLEYQQLERLRSFADDEGQNLASLLLQCAQLTDGIQQINLIKQIVPLLEKMDSTSSCNNMVKSCLDILGITFLSLDIKNPLKRVLASCLNDLPELLIAEATDSFVVCLKEELATTNFSCIRKTIDNLASCVELINIGKSSVTILFKEALQFLLKSVLKIQEENRKFSGNHIAQTRLMHDLLMGIKVSMTLIQRVLENIQRCFWKKLDSPIWQCMCGLLNSFICFLNNEDLLQTVQTSAGLAVVLFIKTMFEPVERLPCLISDLICGLLNCSDVPKWFVVSCGGLCTAELSDSVLLFLCHGALAMLDWKDHSMEENAEKLLLDIASVLLTLSTRLKESVMAASLSRILAIWTNAAMDCLQSSSRTLKFNLNGNSETIESNVGSFKTRGALGALMACLRTARAHGHLQFAIILQDGLVPVSCIKQGLVHQHDEVRIDALGLLCESHRSTEVISIEEMQLIQFFIRYNLNNQSAAVRQQICSLLKKLFCRIYESSQAIHKMQQLKSKQGLINQSLIWDPPTTLQQYQDFISSICSILFESLFPGSSHSSRFTALTLLGTIADIFPNSEGQSQELFQITQEVDSSHAESLLHCFASTFNEVKTLAFDLLMKLHPFLPYFQDPEKLQPLFQVAMQLSQSSKPYDCVTSSYLLNFLIHQKELLKIFSENYQPLGMFQPNEDLLADSLEKNTLFVIKYLLENLEREILQAERSLLHAAASFPMYGRVHCITGALCQLNHMTLTSEWKEVVRKLILMSYKLSAVVSPVVQSSSPEGLIPMDTDLETSERLQSILLEIQPCDTNDYFTEAKLLKEYYGPDCGDGRAPNVCTEIKGKEQHTSDVTAQMVLVCCWRSMKEVSLLLGKLCQLLPEQILPSCSDALITVDQVKDIGEYFKNHLLKSRHRGAFELAYAGFIKLTEVFSRCNNEDLHKLPQQWLYNVLEEIKSSNPSSKLCVTRRSAGIPFYIQALLASEPKKGKANLLKMTMKSLINLALPSDMLASIISQVHALNILRALFKDTRLGEHIIPYVADGMQAAILGFTSSVWAVRNSSTLLFSTLITRIFGVKRGKDESSKKNRMTGREFFTRFPSLYPFLLSQLEQITGTADSKTKELKLHPSLFLLLLVLSKLYPSPMDGTYSALSMASFVPLILRCGNSPVYRSRELAGRALVPFVMLNLVPQTVSSLLAGLPHSTDPYIRQNAVHGTLLQVLHLLQSYLESKQRANSDFHQGLSNIITNVCGKLWLANRQNPCLVTRAAYLDVLVLLNNYLGKAKIKETDINTFWGKISTIILDSELATETVLLWLNQVNAKHVMEEKGNVLLNLLSGLEETLIKIAVKEKHPECFCKILEVLYKMDLRSVLAKMEDAVKMNPREFLHWIMNIANTSGSIEIQSISLKLASELLVYLIQNWQEDLESETKQWLELVSYCCEDEQQRDLRLAAAEILVSITPFFLIDQKLPLGLPDTLFLWRCVVQLLQSEEQIVRDTVAGVIRLALSQENIFRKTELDFHVVNAVLALDLAFSLLCELLQLWGQTGAGVSVLLEWLLKEDDLNDLKPTTVMGNDYLFDKGKTNFWAEKLTERCNLGYKTRHFLD
ncbi:thyroid adenoma-associated protein [Crotalus adamanteus]|uniref:tRNA (32-2'-O)-methyltransferase regulator THADA n=1 Tax=Crotalus adamanteus TaxID=8729 RepID=A0AAW1CCT1_CROAD